MEQELTQKNRPKNFILSKWHPGKTESREMVVLFSNVRKSQSSARPSIINIWCLLHTYYSCMCTFGSSIINSIVNQWIKIVLINSEKVVWPWLISFPPALTTYMYTVTHLSGSTYTYLQAGSTCKYFSHCNNVINLYFVCDKYNSTLCVCVCVCVSISQKYEEFDVYCNSPFFSYKIREFLSLGVTNCTLEVSMAKWQQMVKSPLKSGHVERTEILF